MSSDKIRRQVAWEAARLMYHREVSEYLPAKLKAARRVARGDFKPSDLPSNSEIRDQVQIWANLHEGERRTENLRDMRLEALRMMRILRKFRPRLIGSTLTGHVRRGSDIDLHVFSDSVEAVAAALDAEGFSYEVERKRVRKQGQEQTFVHIHVADRFPFELTIYAGQHGPLCVQELDHRQGDRTGEHRRTGAISRPRVSRHFARSVGSGGGEPGRSVPDLRNAALCRWRT